MKLTTQFLAAVGVFFWAITSVNAQSFLTNGLIAHYPFNGNANDASGNGNNGTVNGVGIGVGVDRFGNANGAFHFSGGGYISVTPTPFSVNSNYCVSLWCKGDVVGGDRADSFLSTGLDGSGGMNIRYVSFQSIHWQFFSGWQWGEVIAGGNGADYANKWTHVCVVKDSSTVSTFINGQIVATNGLLRDALDLGSLWFGKHQPANDNGAYYLIGSLDDVRIYNRALSSNEVATLYYYESPKKVQLAKAYTLDFEGLFVGTNYQLQASTNLSTWSNWGAPFTATSDRYTNAIPYQRVDSWSKLYFRLTPQ
jgi:hypothetical protein